MGNKTKPIKNPEDLKIFKAWLKENDEVVYIFSQVALGTGYRVGDLVKLRVGETREALEKGYFTIIEQKTTKRKRTNLKKKKGKEYCEERFKKTLVPRKAKIKDNLRKLLQRYIKDKKEWEYMFPSPTNKRKPIDPKQTCRVINKATEECNLNICVCNHGLRKTYGYIIYKNAIKDKKEPDYALYLVQRMFCHSSAEITKEYIGLNDEEEDKASSAVDEYVGDDS